MFCCTASEQAFASEHGRYQNHDEGSLDVECFERGPMTEIKNTSVIDFSDISDEQMNEMIYGTLTEFDEGHLVDGVVVKIEHDEVLVDIGFKSEGVIPAREQG